MPVKRTQEEFISLLKEKFNDKFSYDDVIYVNNITPVKIKCNVHNEYFYSTPKHLLGMSINGGCKKCTQERLIKIGANHKGNKYPNRKCYTTETFIEKAKIVHNNKYDYSKSEIIHENSTNKLKSKYITIICPTHGEFQQQYYRHLLGYGCPSCANIGRYQKNASTTEEFINKSIKLHGNKYDYSLVNYINRNTPVTIICPIHGKFEQAPMHHLAGKGCYKCGKGTIPNNENRLKYILEKEFPDLTIIHGYRNKEIFKRQHLDFYIPELKIAIEYQGPQHFYGVNFLTDYRHSYEHTYELDKLKFNICKNEGIKLLYFTFNKKFKNIDYFDTVYTEIDDIIEIIKNYKIN